MNVVIGIDTGGTYTDGVLVDSETGKVIKKTKSATTRNDLSIGIGECIRALDIDLTGDSIKAVCLSTTLATNSVVEEKKSRVGLIYMDHECALKTKNGVNKSVEVRGQISLNGKIDEDVDEEEIKQAVLSMKDSVDALVVSGYFSVRNPIHELRIKKLAMDMTDIAVVCAHELTSSLGFQERTDTAVLNAHLLPVISELISKTRKTLDEENINAEIIVMRGDGTMMKEKQALSFPVETVLSGPAASVVGGVNLIEEENAFFVDLGGTTIDIADMNNGRVAITEEGATINGWKTKVKAADIYTYGLGGDSRLTIKDDRYVFGPQKAIPVCFAEESAPGLADEIVYWAGTDSRCLKGFNRYEALFLNNVCADIVEMDSTCRRIVEMLREGPHSVVYLAANLSRRDRMYGIDALIQSRIVSIVSITPTDLMHASGEYSEWAADAAEKCIELIKNKEETVNACCKRIGKIFENQLAFAIVRSAFALDGKYESCIDSEWFFEAVNGQSDRAGIRYDIRKKIVAIGAPARAWVAKLEDQLNTTIMVPDNYEVANAVGAANGIVCEKYEAMLRYDLVEAMYHVHLPWESTQFKNYEDAREYVFDSMQSHADFFMKEMGISDGNKNIDEDITYYDDETADDMPYEAVITMMISEKPRCFRS